MNKMKHLLLFLSGAALEIAFTSCFSTGRIWKHVASNQLETPVGVQFAVTRKKMKPRRSTPRKSRSSLNMVIERMSDDSVGAIMIAHEVGNELGLVSLTNEIIFVGIVNKPERAGRTLARYGLQYPLAKRSAVKVLQKAGFQLRVSDGGEREGSDKKPLPFSKEAKETLNEAAKIADRFLSESITSEHVLLALMAYNFGTPIDQTKISTAREILLGTEGIKVEDKTKFSAFDFCEEVVEDMKKPFDPIKEGAVQEQVIIGGGSGSTNTLSQVGIDLTQMAVEGKFDRVYGRDKEIRMALRTLGRRRKNNPCLIGDPGVGKTAIAEAIAQVLASSFDADEETKGSKFILPEIKFRNPFDKEIEEDEVEEEDQIRVANNDAGIEEDDYVLPACPKALAGFRLIGIELASLVAGTRNRGDFEEKVQKLIAEASNSNVILFIDEIHNLVGTGGGGDGAMNAANLIKPALARGELRLLGATTTAEYRRYIEKDGALERRFQPLDVVEPSVEETIDILKTVSANYAEYHGVEYTENSLIAAAKLSDRYIADRFLPDKAIDLLDESGSMVKMSDDEEDYFVTEDAITNVVSEITGIPVGRLETGEKDRLRNLELIMGERIKGQSQAVRVVAKAIRRARSGMRDGKRPIASLLFMGPTGVGKTEVTKALADTYFGREKDMIRIDMSEYMDSFSVSRLIGSPPGYVGYDEGGQLTEAVRRKPHSVVLFDEVEKAHEDVLNVLLQIMDEGSLTDGKGRTVNFKNTIIIMTSNLGSEELLKISDGSKTMGEFNDEQSKVIAKALEQAMKPELRNRIDEFVYFKSLPYDVLLEITGNLLDSTIERTLKDQEITLTVSDSIATRVTKEAFQVSRQYGARPIRRAIQRYLEDTMSDAIVREFINPGDEVLVEMADDKNSGVENNKDELSYVKISKFVRGKKESIVLPVDDGGIGSVAQDLQQAIYGTTPSIPDDSPLTENDATWE